MAIAKRPPSKLLDIAAKEAFITGGQVEEADRRGKLTATVIRFEPALLKRIDIAAAKRGLSRAAMVQFLCGRALDAGEG
jgi:hypothetical protein